MIQRSPYPLDWPLGKTRTRRPVRSRFAKPTVAQALAGLTRELDRFEAANYVITTNVEVRLRDGLPKSGQPEPKDSGVAVYFVRATPDGHARAYCFALDQYDRVADNLHALAKVIEAYRAIARHGGGELLEQATSGFAALPPASEPSKADKLRAIIASTDSDGERRAAQAQLDNLEG